MKITDEMAKMGALERCQQGTCIARGPCDECVREARCAITAAAPLIVAEMEVALSNLLDEYVSLVASSPGGWMDDPEKHEVVKAARAALAKP